MRRILLFGSGGQLGWELRRTLATLGEVTALDAPRVDFSRPEALAEILREERPQAVVNAAAYTAVDRAEGEADLARRINATATGVLAEACRELGAAFIHYSTDYVFDGSKGSPYSEEDPVNPLNVYGRTKLEGEQAALAAGGAGLVLRTAWVYSLRRDSFVTKVLRWGREKRELRVVSDQVGSPTWARALAEATAQVLAMGGSSLYAWLQERRGVYHLGGDGGASRLEWAQAILRHDPRAGEQTVTQVLPAASADFPTPAQRPLYTVLDCSKFAAVFGLRLPPWEQALELAMDDAAAGGER